ncbi:CDP-alcohol phosphatidyltransferase family protein [Leptolyngbya sp. FACHB-261]|uniref:CDP-alcohol phosphatidyltransferase family protein n=1 Tax=Leptolyngbya sp. FACHB-261 TaxID=2692806 RepID=UPI001681DB23|nr:CDP-alcohol phosphatidyltransferase family protein [Leptolyngbya sp. FACHB-261]MBD2103434.1 CDP-alcohol phosphatidyltransferase family protein [Leptolyngbya sp. FACHB-261]
MNGIYALKPAFRNALRPLLKLLWPVHPDVLTWSAIGLSGLLGLALHWGQSWLLAVPLLALLRTVLNALDGLLAVETGKARPAGEVINELGDRVSDLLVLSGLWRWVDPWLWASVTVTVLLVSYIGILGKALGKGRQYSGPLGKADRLLLISIGALLSLYWPQTVVFHWLLLSFLPLGVFTGAFRLWSVLR